MSNNVIIHEPIAGIEPAKSLQQLVSYGDEAFAAIEEGFVLSPYWRVTVNGENSTVYAVAVTRGGPHSFTSFDLPEGVHATITAEYMAAPIRSATLSPIRLQIPVQCEGHAVSFLLEETGQYVLQINDDFKHALTISVNPVEKAVPKGDNVFYFGPGIHEVSTIEMTDNSVLYLAAGALLLPKKVSDEEEPLVEKDWAGKPNYQNFIHGNRAKNIKILGRGVIDLSRLDWHERMALTLDFCEDILIEGITITGTAHWTVRLLGCKNAVIDNIKLYGHRENSDGIDIVSSQDVVVKNCFVRTGDDAICVKAMLPPPACGGHNIVVEHCVVWNDKVRCFGIASETTHDISHVIFRHCDVVRSFADWTAELGSLAIIMCDASTISKILFEDIFIEHEVHHAMVLKIMQDKWSTDDQPGHINNITFRRISIPAGVPSLFEGYDKEHQVENITVENIEIRSQSNDLSPELNLKTNEFVANIRVHNMMKQK